MRQLLLFIVFFSVSDGYLFTKAESVSNNTIRQITPSRTVEKSRWYMTDRKSETETTGVFRERRDYLKIAQNGELYKKLFALKKKNKNSLELGTRRDDDSRAKQQTRQSF